LGLVCGFGGYGGCGVGRMVGRRWWEADLSGWTVEEGAVRCRMGEGKVQTRTGGISSTLRFWPVSTNGKSPIISLPL
jgi:hypothetical protein